jgi:DNA (cytosine-5)-methyltransferase 1
LWGETMRFVDWFAGIGGFRLGLEQAGHQCVGFVEWDKRARQSLRGICSNCTNGYM